MDLTRPVESNTDLHGLIGLPIESPAKIYAYGYHGADRDRMIINKTLEECRNSIFLGCVPLSVSQWIADQITDNEYTFREASDGPEKRENINPVRRILYDPPGVHSGLLPWEFTHEWNLPNRVFFVGPEHDDVTMEISDMADETISGQVIANGGAYALFVNSVGITTAIWSPTLNLVCLVSPFTVMTMQNGEREMLRKKMQKLISLVKPAESAAKKFNRSKFFEGTDIEFTVYDSDTLFHSATEFVADSIEGQIGTDGNVETLEIRPEQAKTPKQLTENIEDLLRTLYRTLPPGYDLLGGGGRKLARSTGLHIHFSGTSVDCTKGMRGNPETLVNWLDTLIAEPMASRLRGWARQDSEHYGRYGDYRNRGNHNGFPHEGFEWRVLPTVCINKEITEAVLALAYMVVLTYEEKGQYCFNEKEFGIHWYDGLVDADKYRTQIRTFVDFVSAKTDLAVPILKEWFGKEFSKDKECDITIVFANDEQGYLSIVPFVMYNPQKVYNRIVFWDRGEDKIAISSSEEVPQLEKYLMEQHGFKLTTASPSAGLIEKYEQGSTLFIGLPQKLLFKLHSRSQGSRNKIKMFAQDIIKHI